MNTHFLCEQVRALFLTLFLVCCAYVYANLIPDSIMMIEMTCPSRFEMVDACWDYSNLETVNETQYLRFPSINEDLIDCHSSHAHYYLMSIFDTVSMMGFENPILRAEFAKNEKLFKYPISQCDSFYNEFEILGSYCHSIPSHVLCRSTSSIDGIGSLILPQGGFDSVSCVHVTRTFYRDQFNVPFLYNNLYLWFLRNSREPVFSSELFCDSVHQIASATYIWGEPTPNFVANQPFASQKKIGQDLVSDTLISNASFLPNPFVSDLQIQYNLGRKANVYYSVHYEGGLLVYKSPSTLESVGEHNVSLYLGSLPSATYVVYIHAENTVCSGVVIKL